jgi:hypothetical protein
MLGAVYRERMCIHIVRMHTRSRGTAPKKRVNVHPVPAEPEAEGALEKPQAVSRVFFVVFLPNYLFANSRLRQYLSLHGVVENINDGSD